MICTYFRSSSFNQYGMCPHSYFMDYVLGIPSGTNKKAEMGTIVHKVMEALAIGKFNLQNSKLELEDDVMGKVTFLEKELFSDAFVEYLFNKSYDHYSKKSPHIYKEIDRLTCLDWTFKPLRLLNGIFDPRKRDIVAPELHFDFEIPDEWANYEYEHNGQIIKGKLALKGTIDLITRVSDTCYESTDWKTGQRLDWGSKKQWPHNIKTFEKLMVDPQLRIYHYAIHHVFPQLEQVIPTIYFINDHGTRDKPVPGGAFTMAYSVDDIPKTKEMLRKRFEEIKATTRPFLVKSWKCKAFCHYGRTPHPSGEIDPRTKEPYTICEYVAKKVRDIGIKKVIAEETFGTHTVGNYQSPGA